MLARIPFIIGIVVLGLAPGAGQSPVSTGKTGLLKSIAEYCKYLSSDALEGRVAGSEQGKETRQWLKNWLKKNGFIPLGAESGSYEQPFDGGTNLLAKLQPKNQADGPPEILISVHFDGRRDCEKHPLAESGICNSASDNAAAVAAVMAVLERISGDIGAPIALGLWDHEEHGILGSKHFAEFPTFATDSLRLIVNLDIIGLDLFSGLEDMHFAIGAETGGPELTKDLEKVLKQSDLRVQKLSYAFGHGRSDITRLILGGHEVPFIFFSDGDGSVYHTDADEFSRVNLEKTAKVAEILSRLILEVSRRDEAYQYHSPPILRNSVAPTFGDMLVIKSLISEVLAKGDQNNILPEHLAALSAALTKIEQIEKRGMDAFKPLDGLYLGQVMGEFILLSRYQSTRR